MKEEYVARDERLMKYLAMTKAAGRQFSSFEIQQIGWDWNSHADALASLATAIEQTK